MKIFLDSSVILAASGSPNGGSMEVVRQPAQNQWTLLATPYILDEVEHNLERLSPAAVESWNAWKGQLQVVPNVLTLNRIFVFSAGKDRPVLFAALANADILLTLDRRDFLETIGPSFYGLSIMVPGHFLRKMHGQTRQETAS